MKYQVEVFENDEIVDAGEEFNEEEYKKAVEEVGLQRLAEMLSESGIIPFHMLTSSEKNIWFGYLPGEYTLETYPGYVPLRVIGIIKECVERKYFDKIIIRTESQNDPDPVVFGYRNDNWYIIARWGEELRPWNEIVKLAREKIVKRFETKIRGEISVHKMKIKELESYDPETLTEKYMLNEYIPWELRLD